MQNMIGRMIFAPFLIARAAPYAASDRASSAPGHSVLCTPAP